MPYLIEQREYDHRPDRTVHVEVTYLRAECLSELVMTLCEPQLDINKRHLVRRSLGWYEGEGGLFSPNPPVRPGLIFRGGEGKIRV